MAQKFDNLDSNKLKDPLSYISNEVQNSIFLSLPTAQEISKNITKLINKDSCGYDLVSNRTIKATNLTISPYLEILFSKCIMEGIFPDNIKLPKLSLYSKEETKKTQIVIGLSLYFPQLVKYLKSY